MMHQERYHEPFITSDQGDYEFAASRVAQRPSFGLDDFNRLRISSTPDRSKNLQDIPLNSLMFEYMYTMYTMIVYV